MTRLARRSDFAFAVTSRRVADFTVRAAWFRAACVLAVVVVLAAHDELWWTWLAPIVAGLGCYQAIALSTAVLHDRVPREPVARWAYVSALGQHGQHRVNVSGVIEGVGSLFILSVAVFGLTDTFARLLVLAATVAWTSSTFGAVFTDPAFYNPDDHPPAALEVARFLAGPLLALICAASVALGDWTPGGAWAAFAVSAALLGVSLRIRETDRGLMYAFAQSGQSELAGRNLVLSQAHSHLSGPLAVALMMAGDTRAENPTLYEQIRIARVRLQQLAALEDLDTTHVDLPDSLVRPVEWLTRPYGTAAHVTIEPATLDEADHDIARIVIGDLVSNAARSGATTLEVTLTRDERDLVLVVADDIGNFPAFAWRAPGSSLERLGQILETRHGSLTLRTDRAGSAVTARWRKQSRS